MDLDRGGGIRVMDCVVEMVNEFGMVIQFGGIMFNQEEHSICYGFGVKKFWGE